ncbi:MAG: hypothetical protein EP330_30325 [Deltaproteobacteria bacterium]|nr:MAG: hypothetical protein EP330_30325 [Deltaproteobacteria bacterium]
MLTVLRERVALVLGAIVVTLLLTGTMGYSYVHAQVYDDVCRPVTEVDLSLTEMADINRRAQDYQSDPRREAHLELESDEASFVLAQLVDFDERIRVWNGQVAIQASVPRPGGCVLVDAQGELRVNQQVATFTPHTVRLGDLDVTGLGVPVGSVSWEPADLEDEFPRLAAQLANVDSLEIVDDQVHVRLVDRYKLF